MEAGTVLPSDVYHCLAAYLEELLLALTPPDGLPQDAARPVQVPLPHLLLM